jgi:hypothetical protein
MAPQPEKPYPIAALKTLGKEVAKAYDELSDGQVPEEMTDALSKWEPPGGEKSWPQPLPPDLFIPTFLLFDTAQKLGSDHKLEPEKLATVGGLRMVTADVKKLGKDKALKEAGGAGEKDPEAGPKDGGKPPAPGQLDDTDQELMQAV